MSTKILKTLVKKEMLDVLRDKKTVFIMLVIPIILYPLIFLGAMQLMTFISSSMEKNNYKIVVAAEDEGRFLHKLEDFRQNGRESAEGVVQTDSEASGAETQETAEEEEQSYEITIVDSDSITDYETALNEEEIDVYISGGPQDGRMQYDVYYLSSADNSSYAAGLIMDVFDALKEDLSKQMIADEGLDVQAV